MIALAITLAAVGLAAVLALWDGVRRALAAQVAMAQARADVALSARVDALAEQLARVERRTNDEATARTIRR
jgi:hypothetical protein